MASRESPGKDELEGGLGATFDSRGCAPPNPAEERTRRLPGSDPLPATVDFQAHGGHSKMPGVPYGITGATHLVTEKSMRVTKMTVCCPARRANTLIGERSRVCLCTLEPLTGVDGDSGLGLNTSKQKDNFEAGSAPIGKESFSYLPQ